MSSSTSLLRNPWLRRVGWPLALAACVVLTGWMLALLRDEERAIREDATHTPDFYMENFTTTTMGPDGAPTRRISAEYMAHFADTGSSEFTRPYMVLYADSGPPWQVRSERGWASARDDVMLLLGQVHIWRDSAAGERLVDIHTRDLRVLPATDYGETDQPVLIRRGHVESRGLGMRAYLEDDRLELLSKVRTVYDPPRE